MQPRETSASIKCEANRFTPQEEVRRGKQVGWQAPLSFERIAAQDLPGFAR